MANKDSYNVNRANFSKKRRIKHKAEKESKILLLEIMSSYYGFSNFKTLYKTEKKKSLKQLESYVRWGYERDRDITREIAYIQNL